MDMNELLKEYNVELDEKKQELCCELQHPLLINGKTGSGKTFLLLARNAYLMKAKEVEPSAILNIVHDPAIAKRMAKDYRYIYLSLIHILPPHRPALTCRAKYPISISAWMGYNVKDGPLTR